MHRAIVIVVLLACACSARTVGEDAGVTTMVGEASTTDAQDTSSEVGPLSLGTTGDGDGDSSGDGDGDGDSSGDGDGDGAPCTEPPKLDLPPDFENTPMPLSCTVEPIDWPTPEQYPGCTLCEESCIGAVLGCATPAPGQTCDDICPSGDCIGSTWETCVGDVSWVDVTDACGHFEIDGQCCSIGKFTACIAE